MTCNSESPPSVSSINAVVSPRSAPISTIRRARAAWIRGQTAISQNGYIRFEPSRAALARTLLQPAKNRVPSRPPGSAVDIDRDGGPGQVNFPVELKIAAGAE